MATIHGWLNRTDTPGRWIVRGPLVIIRQHYVPELGKSARCQHPSFCALCAHDYKLQEFGALPISRDGSHVIHLLRLLTKDEHARRWCEKQGTKLQGAIVELQLLGYIDIAPISRRIIPAAPIDNYIAAIGRKAYGAAIEALADGLAPDRGQVVQLPAPKRKQKQA